MAARALAGVLLVVLIVGALGLVADGAELRVHEVAHSIEAIPRAPEAPTAPSALHLAGLCLAFALAGALMVCRGRRLEQPKRGRRLGCSEQPPRLRATQKRSRTLSVLALTGVCLR